MNLPRDLTEDEVIAACAVPDHRAPEDPDELKAHFRKIIWRARETAEVNMESQFYKLYFVRGEMTGLIKIGHTRKDAKHRLAGLQTGSPDKLTLLCYRTVPVATERYIHAMLKKHRVHGEWFHPHEDVFAVMRKYGWKG